MPGQAGSPRPAVPGAAGNLATSITSQAQRPVSICLRVDTDKPAPSSATHCDKDTHPHFPAHAVGEGAPDESRLRGRLSTEPSGRGTASRPLGPAAWEVAGKTAGGQPGAPGTTSKATGGCTRHRHQGDVQAGPPAEQAHRDAGRRGSPCGHAIFTVGAIAVESGPRGGPRGGRGAQTAHGARDAHQPPSSRQTPNTGTRTPQGLEVRQTGPQGRPLSDSQARKESRKLNEDDGQITPLARRGQVS